MISLLQFLRWADIPDIPAMGASIEECGGKTPLPSCGARYFTRRQRKNYRVALDTAAMIISQSVKCPIAPTQSTYTTKFPHGFTRKCGDWQSVEFPPSLLAIGTLQDNLLNESATVQYLDLDGDGIREVATVQIPASVVTNPDNLFVLDHPYFAFHLDGNVYIGEAPTWTMLPEDTTLVGYPDEPPPVSICCGFDENNTPTDPCKLIRTVAIYERVIVNGNVGVVTMQGCDACETVDVPVCFTPSGARDYYTVTPIGDIPTCDGGCGCNHYKTATITAHIVTSCCTGDLVSPCEWLLPAVFALAASLLAVDWCETCECNPLHRVLQYQKVFDPEQSRAATPLDREWADVFNQIVRSGTMGEHDAWRIVLGFLSSRRW